MLISKGANRRVWNWCSCWYRSCASRLNIFLLVGATLRKIVLKDRRDPNFSHYSLDKVGYIDISIIPLMLLFQSASSKKPVSHIFPSRLYTPRQWHTGAGLLLACRSWFCPYCPNSMFRAAMSAAWNQPQCIYTITTAQRYKGRIPPPCQRWVTGTHSGERLACAVVPDILQILLSQPPKCIFRSHFVHHIRWLCLVRSVPVTPGFTEESAGHDLLSSPPQWERRSGSLYLEVTWSITGQEEGTSDNYPSSIRSSIKSKVR